MGITKEKESQSFLLLGVKVLRGTTPAHFLFYRAVASWVETLSVTHGIEDEESSKMVKRLRELARPR